MENHKNSIISSQAGQLFSFYDRAGIGIITKSALLYYFGSIDKLITQQWLNKVLLPRGVVIKEYINCQQFNKIMEALNAVPDQQEQFLFEN